MRKIIKSLSVITILLFTGLQVLAVEVPSNLKIDSFDRTGVNLSWAESTDSIIYLVYYSLTEDMVSWSSMETDYIEWTTTKVSNLEEGQTYYFTVVWIDENWVESDFSEKVMIDYNNSTDNQNIDFVLEWVTVINESKIEADFSLELDNSENAIREFKITNKNDNLDTIEVISTQLNESDSSKLEIDLETNIVAWEQYEFVVIAVNSKTGKNIESWIDSIETFSIQDEVNESENLEFGMEWDTQVTDTTDDSIQLESNNDRTEVFEDNIVEDNAIENNVNESLEENNEKEDFQEYNEQTNIPEEERILAEEWINLNSAWPSEWNLSWVAWENVSSESVENTLLNQANTNSNLPKTWPEHILIIVLSIILSVLVFVFKFRRN